MNHPTAAARLLQLLSIRPNPSLPDQVGQLDLGAWRHLLRQAQYQRIVPLLAYHVRQNPEAWSLVPTTIQQAFKERNRVSSLLSLKAYSQLQRLLPCLQAEDIPVIGLKGAHLAEFVYPKRILRPMRDIDLLIHRRDLEAVDRIMHSLGYELSGDEEWHAQNHFHFGYWSPDVNFTIEIHWDIQKPSSAFPVDLASWWEHAEQKTVGQSHMLVLSPEEALIHACIHLVKHLGQDGFKPLCDVAIMLHSETFAIDWARFIRIVNEQAVIKPINLTLRLASDLLGVDVPQEVIAGVYDPKLTDSVYVWFREQVTSDMPVEKGTRVSSHFAKLWRTRNPFTKVSMILRSMRLAPDGDPTRENSAAATNTSLDNNLFLNRFGRYWQRTVELLRGDPELETEIDVMNWVSS